MPDTTPTHDPLTLALQQIRGLIEAGQVVCADRTLGSGDRIGRSKRRCHDTLPCLSKYRREFHAVRAGQGIRNRRAK